jgi:PD-(D/E)XK endonuclease
MHWLAEHGYDVFIPLGHSPDVDLIALRDSEVLRVQVKTTQVFRNGRWAAAVATRGGNRSWNGIVKRFSPERCDRLFVHVADGRRWFIPSVAVGGGCAVCLGGPKYAAYEVEPGRPFPAGGRASSLS